MHVKGLFSKHVNTSVRSVLLNHIKQFTLKNTRTKKGYLPFVKKRKGQISRGSRELKM